MPGLLFGMHFRRVSIRSRPEDREEPRGRCENKTQEEGFNPLPARRPGGTPLVDDGLGPPVVVSIRSRPEDREEPPRRPAAAVIPPVSIRSRPEDREEPCLFGTMIPLVPLFQSAP